MSSADYEDYEYDEANLTDAEYEDLVRATLWPQTVEKTFVVILLCMMVVGVIGNTLVVVVVISKRSMWSQMNIFLTNLACADLLILIFCLPPTVINDVTKTFWFSELFCKSILFFQNTSVYVSILSLMFITFERWRAITCPLKSPLQATRFIVVGTWVVAMIMSSPEPYTLHLKSAEFRRPNFSSTWGTRCIASWSSETEQQYQIVLTLCAYLSPLLFISILCLNMSRTLNKCELTIGKRQLANRKKAVRMLIAVVCVFALSYLPVHLHNIAATFDLLGRDTDINWIYVRKLLPRVFSYSSSCLNPVLYNFMCSRFRKEFARVVCCNVDAVKPGGSVISRKRTTCERLIHFSETAAVVRAPRHSIL